MSLVLDSTSLGFLCQNFGKRPMEVQVREVRNVSYARGRAMGNKVDAGCDKIGSQPMLCRTDYRIADNLNPIRLDVCVNMR